MFGSISNWVAENKPAMPVMPEMPAMPQIPTVTMPNMPSFLNKNKEASENNPEGVVEGVVGEEPPVKSESGGELGAVVDGEAKVVGASEVVDGEVVVEEGADAGKNTGYKILDSTKEIGSNIGGMLFSFGSKTTSSVRNATSSLKDVIQKKTIIGDFSKENEKFVNDKKSAQRREDAAVAPWVGYNEEERLKEQIIELSKDSRNFLRAPPSGVDFQFDFNTAYPVAMAILDEDPALSEMRFKLVPKQVKEENFWLNYFYRISLIKQTCTLDELNKQNDIDETEWDIKPEDIENISPEDLEKEINSILG